MSSNDMATFGSSVDQMWSAMEPFWSILGALAEKDSFETKREFELARMACRLVSSEIFQRIRSRDVYIICEANKGMFSDELAVTIVGSDGMRMSYFVPKEDVVLSGTEMPQKAQLRLAGYYPIDDATCAILIPTTDADTMKVNLNLIVD
jgi:hypothetical protein